jgi:Na+/melibiose symporter-like transporter
MRNVWHLVRRNRDYRLLLGANLVSQGGDWILAIGMMFYIYDTTRSSLAAGTMLLAALAPQLAFSSLAGVFVDRWDRRTTMVVSNLLLAACLVPLFFVRASGDVWIIYVVVFVQGVLEQFFVPAEAAMVPQVVPADDLVAANALNGQNRQVARLVGAAVGGILAAVGGIALVAVVDLVSYLAAAALVALVESERTALPRVAKPTAPRRVRREWTEGLTLCFGRRDLATLLIFRTMSGFGEGVITVLLAPFVISVLHASGAQYGAVNSALAVGGIVGAVTVAGMRRANRPRALLGYGALAFGALDLMIALYPLALPRLWPVFVLIGIVGFPAAAMNAGFQTLQQTRTPDAFRGRVSGAITTGSAVAMVLGIVLAGALGQVVGIIPIIAIQGLIHVIAGPVVLLRMRRGPADPPDDPAIPVLTPGTGPGRTAS